MSREMGKNSWALLLLMLAGIVVGGFLGYLARDVSWLSWLNYGQESRSHFSYGRSDIGSSFIVTELLIFSIFSFPSLQKAPPRYAADENREFMPDYSFR